MIRVQMKYLALLLILACLLLPVGAVLAQSEPPYRLTWTSVDGGGQMWSAGGGYTLGGTAGQPDAHILSGGGYTLAGGFWSGGSDTPVIYPIDLYRSYLPLLLRAGP
jgi:hypothetical protein